MFAFEQSFMQISEIHTYSKSRMSVWLNIRFSLASLRLKDEVRDRRDFGSISGHATELVKRRETSWDHQIAKRSYSSSADSFSSQPAS